MQINKKFVEQFLAFAILPISCVWMIFEPGFEPLLGIVSGLGGAASHWLPNFLNRSKSLPTTRRISIEYSENNGRYVLGDEANKFETHWTKASGDSIHATKQPPSIVGVAIAKGVFDIDCIKDAAIYDYSNKNVTPQEGEVLLVKNQRGNYAALRIIDIQDKSRMDNQDLVTIEYVLNIDGSTDFSFIANKTDKNISRKITYGATFIFLAVVLFSLGLKYYPDEDCYAGQATKDLHKCLYDSSKELLLNLQPIGGNMFSESLAGQMESYAEKQPIELGLVEILEIPEELKGTIKLSLGLTESGREMRSFILTNE